MLLVQTFSMVLGSPKRNCGAVQKMSRNALVLDGFSLFGTASKEGYRFNGRCRPVGERMCPLFGLVNKRARSGKAQKRAPDVGRGSSEGVPPSLWAGSESGRRKGVCARLDGKSASGAG